MFVSGQWRAVCDIVLKNPNNMGTTVFVKKFGGAEIIEPALTPPSTESPPAAQTQAGFIQIQIQETRYPRGPVDKVSQVQHDDFRQGIGRKTEGLLQVQPSFSHQRARAHPFSRGNLHVRGDGR